MSKRVKAAAASAVANPDRGEHALRLAGATYKLRPSYAAQRAIEAETGLSYAQLVVAGRAGAMHIDHAAIAATHLINEAANGNALQIVNLERIGELIYEEGLPGVMSVLTLLFIDALTGGRMASGEAKAATASGRA